jgi:MFS transporter, PAT family, solute carrier family 33 (acetyl-CoA transportor), member 1
MHLFAKIGWAAHDAATSLKIVEKGLGKEDLAVAVLIDFPFQILGGYLAARWSRGDRPLRPWIWAFWPRLGFALLGAIIIWQFPNPPISTGFFFFLVVQNVFGSFAGCVPEIIPRVGSDVLSCPGLSSLLESLPSTLEYRIPLLEELT